MGTSKGVVATVVGGTTALALAVGSAWAGAPTPVGTAAVIGGGVSTAGMALGAAVSPSRQVSVRIDLADRNEAAAESAAIAAATPGTSSYGRFLSSAQFASRFGPRAADVAAIRAWVRSRGLTVDDLVGDQVLLVHGTAGSVAAAFGGVALRSVSAHGTTGILATGQLRMPAHLAVAVAAVGGLDGPALAATDDLTVTSRHPDVATTGVSTSATAPPCATYFGQYSAGVPTPLPFRAKASSSPECSYFAGARGYAVGANTAKLRKLNYYNPKFQGQGKTVGIVLWSNDPGAVRAANAQAAVNGTAQLKRGQYAAVLTHRAISNCIPADTSANLEQDLDIQAIRTTAQAANIRYYADTRCQVPDLSLTQAVDQNKVQVINNSYGFQNFEYNPHNTSSPNYADGSITHQALVKAANLGITVLFSSGDSGSGALAGNRDPGPSYPATDPFAVAVGGIGFGSGPKGGPAWRAGWENGFYLRSGRTWKRENPVALGGSNAVGSTGGVSRYWGAPAWQRKAGVAVRGKRVVPDISNAADGYFPGFVVFAVQNGSVQNERVGGTSIASPLTAGDVAAALNATGRRRAGLITPAIYAARKKGAVIDIRPRKDAVGASDGGQPLVIGSEIDQEGLHTKAGWDNVTGLGAIGPRFAAALHK